jgi:hypothetical protein
MREYVPDNLDAFMAYDADQERRHRLLKREADALIREDLESDLSAYRHPGNNEGHNYGDKRIPQGGIRGDG